MQLTKNSPLFLVSNALAEYSTPINVAYTDKNARLLGFLFMEITVKTRQNYTVEIYTDRTYRGIGTLVIDGSGMNRNFSSKSTLTGYLLTGISSFFTKIQTTLLTQLILGGIRTFPYTTNDPADETDGYIQYLKRIFDFSDDYVALPCQNDGWMTQTAYDGSIGSVDSMNYGFLHPEFDFDSNISLFTKLKFVIDCIFKENGWTVDYSGIGDTDWENLILFSAKPVPISTITYEYDSSIHIYLPVFTFVNPLQFSLAASMPTEVTCAQFLTSIFLRYGWTAICNTETNTCSIIALKETGLRASKDWTKYASAASNSDFSAGQEYYNFKNDFNGGDAFPSAPTFDNLTIGASVNAVSDLPAVSGSYDNTVIYVFRVNQWYQVTVNDDGLRVWTVFADNIYDDQNGVPDDADTTNIQDASGNDNPALPDATINTFETNCNTLPIYNTIYSTEGAIPALYGWLPYCKQNFNDVFDIRTLLYHGMVNGLNADGTVNEGVTYPFGSSTICLPDGTNHLSWSNVYTHPTADGSEDYGIVKYWWQRWINIINGQENNITRRLFVPLTELLNYKWDDVILIKNVPYLISSYIDYPDYKGFIDATLQRINLGTS